MCVTSHIFLKQDRIYVREDRIQACNIVCLSVCIVGICSCQLYIGLGCWVL